MATTIHLYQKLSVVIDGRVVNLGSLTDPASITADGQLIEKKFQVAVSTTQKLFDSSLDLATFKVVWVQSDFDVMIEKVTDDNGSVGDEAYTERLLGSGVAGRYGPPMVLSSQVSYGNYTKNFGGGMLDLIDIIRCRNLSADQVAQVLFCAIK